HQSPLLLCLIFRVSFVFSPCVYCAVYDRYPLSFPTRRSSDLESRPDRCPIATEEATSPPACPPIPSATTSRWPPAYPESWLLDRTRPTSERAAYRSAELIADLV